MSFDDFAITVLHRLRIESLPILSRPRPYEGII
jgi:hypothetical protein